MQSTNSSVLEDNGTREMSLVPDCPLQGGRDEALKYSTSNEYSTSTAQIQRKVETRNGSTARNVNNIIYMAHE